jgi:hypothetical protein
MKNYRDIFIAYIMTNVDFSTLDPNSDEYTTHIINMVINIDLKNIKKKEKINLI